MHAPRPPTSCSNCVSSRIPRAASSGSCSGRRMSVTPADARGDPRGAHDDLFPAAERRRQPLAPCRLRRSLALLRRRAARDLDGDAKPQRSVGVAAWTDRDDAAPVTVVPAGWWQAAKPTGDYALVGCTVAPGFEFADFVLARDLDSYRIRAEIEVSGDRRPACRADAGGTTSLHGVTSGDNRGRARLTLRERSRTMARGGLHATTPQSDHPARSSRRSVSRPRR